MTRDSHADILYRPSSHGRFCLTAETPRGVEYLREIVREQPKLVHRLAIELSDPDVVRQTRAHGLLVAEVSPVELAARSPSQSLHFALVYEGSGI